MKSEEQDDPCLKPLACADGEPGFAEPWQAQALAMADILIRSGLFSASSWSETLGRALRDSKHRNAPDGQDTYYQCVLMALESLIAEHTDIDKIAMKRIRSDWENAYLSTPHGHPVELNRQT